METVGASSIWSFLDGNPKIQKVSNHQVRSDRGYLVKSYLELAAKVAELQFRNRDHVLFFRGQGTDHATPAKTTTLKPSIFRPPKEKKILTDSVLRHRYACLKLAEQRLAETYETLGRLGTTRVQRQRLLRWAILQHYEVCDTPLLDVTQSLRIAASFASLKGTREGFLYALAVPNLSGAITASAEAGIQMARLSSVCPPSAIRPHIQEGYLLGEYPDMAEPDQKAHYKPYQLDFGRRLIGKFRFQPGGFWSDPNFPSVAQSALYPVSKDWLEKAASEIHDELASL